MVGLVPFAELQRRGLIGYDGYNRMLLIPLLLFAVALSQAALARGDDRRVVRGLALTAAGAFVLATGNAVEFYAVLLQVGLNAYAASQADVEEHWVGSDIGWMVFGVGMLVMMVGSLITAFALDRTQPR